MNPKIASATSSFSRNSPSPPLAERLVLATFEPLQRGKLRIELPGSRTREFGSSDATGSAIAPGVSDAALLRVRRQSFFRKCLFFGDIGFAESYIDGDWETPDLTAVIGWFILNFENAPTVSGSARSGSLALNFFRAANRVGHLLRRNSRRNASRNIREHYDLSNEFFALWLDPSMMYSSALWESAGATLETAQTAKNDVLCRKLHLSNHDHVLEIGTGWGGWSIHAAKTYGCRVTTLTLSPRQRELALSRIAEAGLSDRIDVRLQDYRDVTGTFDKIVSIEMLEAVGHRYLSDFAATCDRCLKRDGLVALQYITCPDSRYGQLRRGVDFIQKHIFPGSLLLSANRLNELLSEHGGFVLHHLEDMGRHYARTLRTWRERFLERIGQVRGLGFDDRFIRKWHYYLAYCEAAFALRNISVVQSVHTRPNNLAF